jgi:type I restriction enzyme S subunit
METVALRDVALSLQDGPFGSNLKSSHYVDHGVRVVRLQNIGPGYFDDRDRAFVTEEHFNLLRKHECRPGDVLIATLGDPIVRACLQPPWLKTALHKADCLRLRCDPDRMAPEYIVRFLNSDALQAQAKGLAHGQTRPRVNLGQLGAVTVPFPPLVEQRRIADILDHADALRGKRRHTLAHVNDLAYSVFIEMFGDPLTNPRGWPDHVQLGDVAQIVSGITKGRKLNGLPVRTVPYLAVVNVQDRALDLRQVKTIAATEPEIERYRLEKNDLLLTEGGDPDKLGRGTLWSGEIDECIHQNHIFRVRLTDSRFLPVFVNWVVGSERGKRYFLQSAKQTTGIASINLTQLRGFPLIQPPIELQCEFARVLQRVHEQREVLEAAAGQQEELFSSLQYRAFRGEL